MDKNSMKNALLIILSLFLLTACQHDIPFAYKMDIQQGNMLDPEDVEQIKVGMSKAQVDHILGMPRIAGRQQAVAIAHGKVGSLHRPSRQDGLRIGHERVQAQKAL